MASQKSLFNLNLGTAKKTLKKLRELAAGGILIATIAFAIPGFFYTAQKLKWFESVYRDDAKQVSKSSDGITYYVCTDTVRRTAQGRVTATIILEIGQETETHIKKMLETKRMGRDPRRVWGVERDTEIDLERGWYRTTQRRIIDSNGETLVTYTGVDNYWMKILRQSSPFKTVIDEITEQNKKTKGGNKT